MMTREALSERKEKKKKSNGSGDITKAIIMKEKERITTKRERERSLGECMVQKGHNIETSMFLEGFLRF